MSSYFFPPKAHPALIHHRRHARNGRLPEAALIRRCTDGHNNVVGYHRKNLFSGPGNVQTIPAGAAGTTDLWSFRCHVGTGVGSIRILMGMAQTASGTDPRVQWDWTISGGATTSLDAIRYGLATGTPSDTPDEWGWIEQVFSVADGLTENTTYEVKMDAIDYARPFTCAIWEQSKTAYLSSDTAFIGTQPSVGSRIYDSYREGLAQKGVTAWKRNARHLWNWTKNSGTSAVNTSTTWKNVIDTSITTVSSATPGVSPDTTYDARLSQTTIPCVFAVRAYKSGTNNGEARLQTASGTVATITGITAATPTWYSTTFNLTPGTTKHDVQFRADGVTTNAYVSAYSIYEYEA